MNQELQDFLKKHGVDKIEKLTIDQLFEYQQSIEPLTQMYKDVFDLYKDALDKEKIKELFIDAAKNGKRFYCVLAIEDRDFEIDTETLDSQENHVPCLFGIDDFETTD